jgi:hypothetical protein
MKLLSPDLWLQQAKADEAASRAKGALAECHRRYLLQQAYEKAVKALALACLTKKQRTNKRFASALGDCFLHHHTPWTVFSTMDDAEWKVSLLTAYDKDWAHLLKDLKALRNHVAARLQQGADAATVTAWKRIDATRPSKAADAVSYRYPFVDAKTDPEGVAPSNWKGWTAYQGDEKSVREAVAELFRRAGVQIGIWKRGT